MKKLVVYFFAIIIFRTVLSCIKPKMKEKKRTIKKEKEKSCL